jgi:hypothetical protein
VMRLPVSGDGFLSELAEISDDDQQGNAWQQANPRRPATAGLAEMVVDWLIIRSPGDVRQNPQFDDYGRC